MKVFCRIELFETTVRVFELKKKLKDQVLSTAHIHFYCDTITLYL